MGKNSDRSTIKFQFRAHCAPMRKCDIESWEQYFLESTSNFEVPALNEKLVKGSFYAAFCKARILRRTDLLSKVSKTFLPFRKLWHRFKPYSLKNSLPTVRPVMSQQ